MTRQSGPNPDKSCYSTRMKNLWWLAAVLLVAGTALAAFLGPWREAADSYQPLLEFDPPPPEPPDWAVRDFQAFLGRLRQAAAGRRDSLLLHREGLERAEAMFRNTAGVLPDAQIEMHAPFFAVDPEAIYALYADLPSLERGMALYQQSCSGCHGPFGRGNGAATREWYAGNYPRNFWYGKFKSRSTAYGRVPDDSDLFRTITRGMYGSSMPSFRHLSQDDRWSLVQFIKTLANFDDDYEEKVVNLFDPEADQSRSAALAIATEPPVSLDSVTRGRILFIEQGCVSCHQGKKHEPVGLARWEGNFNWYDEMQRPVEHSRDLTTGVFRAGAAAHDVFRIITLGPNIGPMPNYQSLPEADRWALVHYVRSTFKSDYPQPPASADAQAKAPPPLPPTP
jgi:mono/diheme cytochrome c family protein